MDKYLHEALIYAARVQSLQEKTSTNFIEDEELLKKLLKLSFKKIPTREDYLKAKELLSAYKQNKKLSKSQELTFFNILKLGVLDFPFAMSVLKRALKKQLKNKLVSRKNLESFLKGQEKPTQVFLLLPPVIGEKDLALRLEKFKTLLKHERISSISVNLDDLSYQQSLQDYEGLKTKAAKELAKLYDFASLENKGVHLSIKSYSQLALSIAVFKEGLKAADVDASISLPLCFKESFSYLQELIEFSKQRVNKGCKSVKIRLVKGAFTKDEERLCKESGFSFKHWKSKEEIDAAYARALSFIFENKSFFNARFGIATKNIFLLSLAYISAKNSMALSSFSFELLGKNPSYEFESLDVIPVYENFSNAFFFLEKELRKSSHEIGSHEWDLEKACFIASIKQAHELDFTPYESSAKTDFKKTFTNTPPLELTLKSTRKWLFNLCLKYKDKKLEDVFPSTLSSGKKEELFTSSSLPAGSLHFAGKFNKNDFVNEASFEELEELILKAALLLEERKDEVLGLLTLESGLGLNSALLEYARGLDYMRYYQLEFKKLRLAHTKAMFYPKGSVFIEQNPSFASLVAFISVSLLCKNTVFINPCKLLSHASWLFCQCLFDAGLSKKALAFVPLKDLKESFDLYIDFKGSKPSSLLLKSSHKELLTFVDIPSVIYLEKNKDLDFKALISCAFLNPVIKRSVLLCDEELLKDEEFKEKLVDALSSTSFENSLKECYKFTFHEGKEAFSSLKMSTNWLPLRLLQKPVLISPSLCKDNGSFLPTLFLGGVKDFKDALKVCEEFKEGVNLSIFASVEETPFMQVNSFYNKSSENIKVGRELECQGSSFGTAFVPGNTSFLTNFTQIKQHKFDSSIMVGPLSVCIREYSQKQSDARLRSELDFIFNIALSYHFFANFFLSPKKGQGFFYESCKMLAYRVRENDSFSTIMSVVIATTLLNTKLYLSYEENEALDKVLPLVDFLKLKIDIRREVLSNFLLKIPTASCIRYLGEKSLKDPVFKNAALNSKKVLNSPPCINGYFELSLYLKESSISKADD